MTLKRVIVGGSIGLAAIVLVAGCFVYGLLQEERLVILNETDEAMHVAMDDFAGRCVEGTTIAPGQTIEFTNKSDFFCANAMLTFSGGEIRSVSCTWSEAHRNQPVHIDEAGVSCPTITPIPARPRSP